MNIAALRTFLAIVDTGSLVRAAQVLNVTQSTVTARLQTLEAELGQTLILRQKSGAVLTPAGERLRRYARTINDLWRQARQETALPDGLDAVCNIACEPDLWPHLGEALFTYLRQHHPDVAISVWHGSATDVAGWMASGKSDLALSYAATRTTRHDQIALPDDRLILVSSDPASPIRFDPGYVFVEAGEAFGAAHAAAYADADTARISFSSATLGLRHLLGVGGSAYLPERIANGPLQRGQLHRIDGAQTFDRPAYLTINAAARRAWTWFDAAAACLFSQHPA